MNTRAAKTDGGNQKSTAAENEFERMIRRLTELQLDLMDSWSEVEREFDDFDQQSKDSARNLVYYMGLRRYDMRALQNDLARHGISSLGRSESYVMTNINKVLKLLHRIVQRPFDLPPASENELSLDEGRLILKDRTDLLLGREPENRNVRIMVTLPGEAADNYGLVRDLIVGGMNCARINCAHDDVTVWKRMVKNIRRAQKETGRDCKISVDISGPKLRTGALEGGARVLKWHPAKDAFGEVTDPARIWLTPDESPEASPFTASARLRLPKYFLKALRAGDKIKFKDARGSRRLLIVMENIGNSFWAECRKTAYITPETKFKTENHKLKLIAEPGEIPPLEQFISLQQGDFLILTRSQIPGRPAKSGENGEAVEPARVPCTLPEVFDDVQAGENVWFDDGKIGGIIRSVEPEEILIEITRAGAKVQKLRADKGINLPDSDLRLPSLTDKDLVDLEFVVRSADLVGYSFVRSAADVRRLQEKLKELNGTHPGIVLKIETRRAFEQLPEILLTAMRSQAVGVMIARGDLAIETGFERLAEVQEEILWMCEAAHVPVIWATQVLEKLSREGVYSRAEITDAAMSERAECVMLNKGAFIVEAVRTLDDILTRMQSHQDKKRPMLRHLHLADRFFEKFKKKDRSGALPENVQQRT
jgi:pyruvate kinase